MAKKKTPNHTSEVDGCRVEWRRRRGFMDADVYEGGELIGEYEYPTIDHGAGVILGGYDDFAREAVMMAKRDRKEKG